MGRRSRKRGTAPRGPRTERPARKQAATPARRRSARPSAEERPPPPWGSFPLSELLILAGLVVLAWGFFGGGDRRGVWIGAGLALASIGGAELALREHLGGFRSHSALLAGVATFLALGVLVLVGGAVKAWLLLALSVPVFAGTFWAMRRLFKRRSGGLGFR